MGDDGSELLDGDGDVEIIFDFYFFELVQLEGDLCAERLASNGFLMSVSPARQFNGSLRRLTLSGVHCLLGDSGKVDKVAF